MDKSRQEEIAGLILETKMGTITTRIRSRRKRAIGFLAARATITDVDLLEREIGKPVVTTAARIQHTPKMA